MTGTGTSRPGGSPHPRGVVSLRNSNTECNRKGSYSQDSFSFSPPLLVDETRPLSRGRFETFLASPLELEQLPTDRSELLDL